MTIGIYGIFGPNGKVYIGQSINIKKRICTHRRDLDTRKNHSRGSTEGHSSPHLQNSWDKYGRDSFTFQTLEKFDEITDIEYMKQLLTSKEQWWMDFCEEQGLILYNHAPSAGSCLGVKHKQSTKDKIRERLLGVPKTPEHTKKVQAALELLRLNPEYNEKAAIKQKEVWKSRKLQGIKSLVDLAKQYNLAHRSVDYRIKQGISLAATKDEVRALGVEKQIATKITNGNFIECFGEKHTLRDWGKIRGMNWQTIQKRMNKGQSPEQAMTIPVEAGHDAHYLEIDGVTKRLSEWGKETNQDYHTIKKRLDRGWTTKEAVFGIKSE